MSGITSITRDWGPRPSIVRIVTTDTLETASAVGYITAQAANIILANNGPFEWLANDAVLVAGSDGDAFAMISSDFSTLLPLNSLSSSTPVTLAQWLAMSATPILLVPAAGANTLLVLNRMEIELDYGTVVLAGGGVVAAQYGNTALGAGPAASNTEAAADFFVTADTTFLFNGATGAKPYSTTANTGIYLSNTVGAFTGGTGSTFEVVVQYNIIPLI